MKNKKPTILFDNICNLCDFSVNFIIKHDTKAYFYFASIQSSIGQSLIDKYNLQDIDSIILIENNKAYSHSQAILLTAKELESWHRYLYIFIFLPIGFRDFIYKSVAKYRYRFFGKKDSCMMPNDEILSRFLDLGNNKVVE